MHIHLSYEPKPSDLPPGIEVRGRVGDCIDATIDTSSDPDAIIAYLLSDAVLSYESDDDFEIGSGWAFADGDQAIHDAGYDTDSLLSLYCNSGADDVLIISNGTPDDLKNYMAREDTRGMRARTDYLYFVIDARWEGLYNLTHATIREEFDYDEKEEEGEFDYDEKEEGE